MIRPGGSRRVTGSVQLRITALATLTVLVVLAVTGFALLAAQRHVLTAAVDEGVADNADRIEGLAAAGELPAAITGLGEDDTVAQVVAADGQIVAASANVEGEAPVGAAPAGQDETVRTVHDIPDGDGAAYRLLSRRIDTPDGPAVIHVAATLDDIQESLSALTRSLLVAIPVVVVLFALLIGWLVGRMLRRIDHAAERQRHFVADASHELRGPLTRMRSALEVDLAHPDHADLGATHQSVLEETVALQHLVEDLLQLARSDARTIPPGERRPVDLDDLVMRLARRLRDDGRVAVDTTGVTAAQVRGDADQLLRAVGNVLDNAARHASARVTVTLAEESDHAVLTVTDDGPGIPAEHHRRVFERFTRLDDARTAGTGGVGLGLAIANEIVHHHGGTIAIDPHHQPGARFVITLPLNPPPPVRPAGRPPGAVGSAAPPRARSG